MSLPDYSKGESKDDAPPLPASPPPPAFPPLPAFADVAKSSNDLLNKDFYHVAAANLEVKLKTPTGVAINFKGKQVQEGSTSGSVDAKYTFQKGITATQAWNTAKVLDTKLELDGVLADGAKIEGQTFFNPDFGAQGHKLNLSFKQPQVFARAFFDAAPAGNINALADVTVGHQGWVAGGEVGYDVNSGSVTRYSATAGYLHPSFTAALSASNKMQLYAFNFYQKLNTTEAGLKTTYDIKNGNAVGLELAAKYKTDPGTFVKGKINHQGIAALAYNTKLNNNLTFGAGLSLDTNKLTEAGHKVGASFTFEG